MKTDLESVYLKILTETCDNEQGPVPKPRPWAHSQASHYSLALENSGVNSYQNPLFAMVLLSHITYTQQRGRKVIVCKSILSSRCNNPRWGHPELKKGFQILSVFSLCLHVRSQSVETTKPFLTKFTQKINFGGNFQSNMYIIHVFILKNLKIQF